MNQEAEKTTRTRIRWVLSLLIVWILIISPILIDYTQFNKFSININITSNNETNQLAKLAFEAQEYGSCIDRCKYIELRYNATKEEAYDCFWKCER
jgi:hypothetical protein